MSEQPAAHDRADTLGEARAIAMERYDLTEGGAVALLTRLARRHKVELQVVALAVVAAAVARRAAAS
jgi:AmiR/NasT family two-component response regulator